MVPILEALQDLLAEEGTYAKLYIGRFTVESLIEHMSWHEIKEYDPDLETEVYNKRTKEWDTSIGRYVTHKVRSNTGLFVRDEYTSFLQGQKHKGWMAGLSEVLSESYDGTILPRYIIKHGWQSVPNCNYSFLSASTRALYHYLRDNMFFIKGLGNRIDYTLILQKLKAIRKTRRFFMETNRKQRKDDINNLAKGLLDVMKSPIRAISVEDSAADLWIEYDYETQKNQLKMNKIDLRYAYLNRQPEKALRRAGFFCLSRNIHAIKGLTNLAVREEDMKLAVFRQKELYDYFKKMLKDRTSYIGENEKTADTSIEVRAKFENQAETRKVFTLVSFAKDLGYSYQNKQFKETINQLVEEGIVELIPKEETVDLVHNMGKTALRKQCINGKPRGIPPIMYKYMGEEE